MNYLLGTRCVSKAFERKGHKTYCIEWDKKFEKIDLYADIGQITKENIIELCGGVPDVIWTRPDCTTYSVAGISHHRIKNKETGELDPISDYAKKCDSVNRHLIDLIKELNPQMYFIENPRGGLRKMKFMQGLPRYTITYCQYETDKPIEKRRMKPTDIWTNVVNPNFKPACKNGDSCHAAAPRHSQSGTQGLKNNVERSKIPDLFCDYIVKLCERRGK